MKTLAILVVVLAVSLHGVPAEADTFCLTTFAFPTSEYDLAVASLTTEGFVGLLGTERGQSESVFGSAALVSGDTAVMTWTKNGDFGTVAYKCELDLNTFSGPATVTRVLPDTIGTSRWPGSWVTLRARRGTREPATRGVLPVR